MIPPEINSIASNCDNGKRVRASKQGVLKQRGPKKKVAGTSKGTIPAEPSATRLDATSQSAQTGEKNSYGIITRARRALSLGIEVGVVLEYS